MFPAHNKHSTPLPTSGWEDFPSMAARRRPKVSILCARPTAFGETENPSDHTCTPLSGDQEWDHRFDPQDWHEVHCKGDYWGLRGQGSPWWWDWCLGQRSVRLPVAASPLLLRAWVCADRRHCGKGLVVKHRPTSGNQTYPPVDLRRENEPLVTCKATVLFVNIARWVLNTHARTHKLLPYKHTTNCWNRPWN